MKKCTSSTQRRLRNHVQIRWYYLMRMVVWVVLISIGLISLGIRTLLEEPPGPITYGENAREEPFQRSRREPAFHRDSCSFAVRIPVEDLQGFPDRSSALDRQLVRCSICKP